MSENNVARHVLETSIADFISQKALGDRSLAQLDEAGLNWSPEPESNSVVVIVKHMSGNMVSRWTEFLTSDGEKPNRNRDDEFVDDLESREQLLEIWEQGWSVLFGALEALKPEDLLREVKIRGQAHTVLQAIHRQISHYGYHIGQIVYAAKAYKSEGWQTLSIAKGKSGAFNDRMKKEPPQ
ncbi:DUF1572 domain-containing protein [Cohnella endophytica]|uniref:DUF1572 domain-containing protein n=1 Tax=Cohnella endophytica TaxID=2419778 RepID=A0A494XXH9_9BACL|nr:DUF1572 family protein [Cohnella endophytica]RKP55192.1 DUF1572 domain-containing protein [Cohnella endophytica]